MSYILFACVVISLQEKLLEPQYHEVKPDVEFLESFADVVGSKWPSLAASLSMSGDEIEDMRKKGYSHIHCALQMLQKWISTEEATYGWLCERLSSQLLLTPSALHQCCGRPHHALHQCC